MVQLFILTDIGPARLHTKKSSGHHTRTHQLKSIKEDQSVEQSESEEADDDGNRTNFDGTDSSLSDFEDPKSIAKTLSTEVCQLSHI
jgi:hypothetical protein